MRREMHLFPYKPITPIKISDGDRYILDLLLLLDGKPITQCPYAYQRMSLRRVIGKGFAEHVGPGVYVVTPLGEYARRER